MATPEATVRREILARVPAFTGLESRQLDELAQVTHTRRLKPKEELCHKGDPGTQVWVIVKGRLRVVTSSIEGGDVQFSIMDPGEVCGELALFAGGERTATMTAVDDVELLSLDRRDFIPFLKRNPDAAIHLLEAMAERVRRLSEQMEDRVFLGLPARLAKKLLSLAAQYGEETEGGGVRIEMRLSQGELGTMVGTSRESVNKQMRAWEGAGIVQSERGVITLISEAELEEVVGSGDGS
jgi:CRP/FNR family cyclic AMP-dependent transcriptional regulator